MWSLILMAIALDSNNVNFASDWRGNPLSIGICLAFMSTSWSKMIVHAKGNFWQVLSNGRKGAMYSLAIIKSNLTLPVSIIMYLIVLSLNNDCYSTTREHLSNGNIMEYPKIIDSSIFQNIQKYSKLVAFWINYFRIFWNNQKVVPER